MLSNVFAIKINTTGSVVWWEEYWTEDGHLDFATYWLCELGKVTMFLWASGSSLVKQGGLTVCDFGLTQIEMIFLAQWLA